MLSTLAGLGTDSGQAERELVKKDQELKRAQESPGKAVSSPEEEDL
jgi:hypothetical protein